ncbi:MAG: peptidase E [Burkholderiales bacterium]|nr:peptidase E [Burkholderiales bacterium]
MIAQAVRGQAPSSIEGRRTICALSSLPRGNDVRLLKYALSLAGKPRPKLLLIPTAVGDDPRWIEFWVKRLVPKIDCEFEILRLFGDSTNMKAHHPRIMNTDAIFVAGGNTLNALAVWRAQGIDASLRAAWEKGVVLSGESAGMICWFEQGLSDSRPEKLTVVEGLGFLPGSVCPHHDNAERRDTYRELVARGEIKAGYGCDGGTGLMFRDTKFDKAVTTDVARRVVSYARVGDAVQEHALSVEVI